MATNSNMTATKMQTAATVVGALFGVVGVAGFIPGITTDYDTMEFAGHHSEAMLLGIFQVSVLHNIIHLLFAVAGLLLARRWHSARLYLIFGGLIYFVLWIYGLATNDNHESNVVPLNTADDWLHLGLGVVMIGLAALFSRELGRTGRDIPSDARMER